MQRALGSTSRRDYHADDPDLPLFTARASPVAKFKQTV
jgi:hypothetical protein